MSRVFLTAEWKYLAILNYRVPPELLVPLVPDGTTLDLWNGIAYLSVVGLLFRDTRILGLPIPWHRTFEEVNLRFYVRREVAGEIRRAATFIREIVPRRAVATVARLAYNEPYRALPMRHQIRLEASRGEPTLVEYEWKATSEWAGLRITPDGPSAPLVPGSEEEFITQHYWGYTRQRDGSAVEYEVRHSAWRIWSARDVALYGNLSHAFGEFSEHLHGAPHSAWLADGSAVSVHAPVRLAGNSR
jgi:uncharacterized protein YqjF (DUF2071 family)